MPAEVSGLVGLTGPVVLERGVLKPAASVRLAMPEGHAELAVPSARKSAAPGLARLPTPSGPVVRTPADLELGVLERLTGLALAGLTALGPLGPAAPTGPVALAPAGPTERALPVLREARVRRHPPMSRCPAMPRVRAAWGSPSAPSQPRLPLPTTERSEQDPAPPCDHLAPPTHWHAGQAR
ncbi:hypothetical protein GCM10009539_59020 [Cryptosporangium japonicum]|uniref:Uncharacterized protein n=1 Tax=Cryptosporangium japonicum TaxID=80872 RepID=A0ABP3EJI7_9ACTN